MRLVLTHNKAHYAETASAKLVRTVGDTYRIYQVTTHRPQIDTASAVEADSSVVGDFQVKENPYKGILTIEGEAFHKEISSFKSRVYVGITNKKGKEKLYYATQCDNDQYDLGENGRYSKFFKKRKLPKGDYSVAVYLDTGEKLYRISKESM